MGQPPHGLASHAYLGAMMLITYRSPAVSSNVLDLDPISLEPPALDIGAFAMVVWLMSTVIRSLSPLISWKTLCICCAPLS